MGDVLPKFVVPSMGSTMNVGFGDRGVPGVYVSSPMKLVGELVLYRL